MVLSFTACKTSPKINFHYDYDSTQEVLDTSSSAWYLPIEKDFVDFFNGHDSTKFLVDPNTLRGTYWKSAHAAIQSLPNWALADKIKYYVDISSEGIGFDGYAIVSFLRVTNGVIEIDASYGTFSNNYQRDYSSSFYKEPAANEATAAADLATRRKNNTLFFGQAPHPVVNHALLTPTANLYIELGPEDYEYRLLNCKTKFGTDIHPVDQTYLNGDFQQDWRYLLTRASDWTTLMEPQLLFPNLTLQEKILKSDSSAALTRKLADLPNPKEIFTMSKSNSLQVELLGTIGSDSIRLVFDTSASHRNPKTADKTILGNNLIALCYEGEGEAKSAANGHGRLYLAGPDLDTGRSGYATIDGTFKNGYLDGPFDYYWHDPGKTWMVAHGTFEQGQLNGKITKGNQEGYALSSGYYANGIFRKDTVAIFHNFDNVTFWGQYPKISDAYMGYLQGEFSGIEIPYDTTFQFNNYSLFIRDNIIYIKFTDRYLFFQFLRDYNLHKIVPAGPLTVFFDNGLILRSMWDDDHFCAGPSQVFVPGVGWESTTVVNGNFHYQVPGQGGGGGALGDVGDFLKHSVTDPFSVPGQILNVATGKASPAQAFAGIKSDFLSSMGATMKFNGDIVEIFGQANQKLLDLTAPAYKALQNCNNALFPIASKINLSSGAGKLGLGNAAENLVKVASWAPGFAAQVDRAASELATKSALLTGLASEKLGEYMELSAGGFPKPVLNSFEHGTVPKATASVTVSQKVVQRLLDNLFAKPITQDGIEISITGSKTITFNSQHQSIDVAIAGGNLSGKEIVSGTVTIDHASMQFLPSLNRRDGHFYLDLHAIVTQLDLKNSFEEIDRMAAWAIQTEFLNKRLITSVDVTSLLNRDLKMKLKGQKELSTNTFRNQEYGSSIVLENIAWSIADGKLILSTALSIHNPTTAAPFTDVSQGKPSTVVDALGNLLGVDCHSFPSIKPLPLPSALGDTDLVVALNENFMENLVANIFNHSVEIPLSQDASSELSNEYIIINRLLNFHVRDNNHFEVGVAADLWYRTLHPIPLKTRLRVTELNLVLTPTISRNKDSTWLELPAQIKTLRIEGVPQALGQCIANYVAGKGYLDRDSLDLTPTLTLHIKSPFDTTANIAPKIKQANILTDQTWCKFFIKIE
jgi:hypothetical protein